jgi:hypothetical protein
MEQAEAAVALLVALAVALVVMLQVAIAVMRGLLSCLTCCEHRMLAPPGRLLCIPESCMNY